MAAWYAEQPKEENLVAGVLARHFHVAGRVAKAIGYYQQAGQYAVRLAAHAEAIVHYRQALALLATLPPTSARDQQEVSLQLALGVPLLSLHGYADPIVQQTYERARWLCAAADNSPELVTALYGLSSFYTVQGNLAKGLALGKEMLRLAEWAEVDDFYGIAAHLLTGLPLFFMGEFQAAAFHFEQVIAAYQPERHRDLAYQFGQDSGISALCWLGHAQMHLGYLAQARTLDHPLTLAFALHMAGTTPCGFAFEEWETAVSHATEMLQIANEWGFALFQMLAQFHLGHNRAQFALSQPDARTAVVVAEGLAAMEQGVATMASVGSELSLPSSLVQLANVYQQVGKTEAGLACLAKAEPVIRKNGERSFASEFYRVRGELLLQLEQADAAETCFQEAIAVAQQQHAKHFELRAAVSLARLWQRQGKYAAATALLSAICGWFEEGVAVPDLKTAVKLLQNLSSVMGEDRSVIHAQADG